MAEHAGYMRTTVQTFRQWRAVLVEASLLAKDGLNEIDLVNEGKSDVTIFGDTALANNNGASAEPGLLPSPDYFASDRMLISLTSKESRINTLATTNGLPDRSFIRRTTGGLSGDHQSHSLIPLRLRLGVVAAGPASEVEAQSRVLSAKPAEGLSVSLTPQLFHWYAREKGGLRLNKAVLKGVGPVSCDIDLRPVKSSGSECTQLAVVLTGQARTNSGPGRLGVSACLEQ